MTPHAQLVNRILLHNGKRRWAVLWKVKQGKVKIKNRWVAFGLTPGASDLIGIRIRGRRGRFIAIEVKAGSDKLTKKQAAFLRIVRKCGGQAFVLTDRNIDRFEELMEALCFRS